jgi:hypothetical protein
MLWIERSLLRVKTVKLHLFHESDTASLRQKLIGLFSPDVWVVVCIFSAQQGWIAVHHGGIKWCASDWPDLLRNKNFSQQWM